MVEISVVSPQHTLYIESAFGSRERHTIRARRLGFEAKIEPERGLLGSPLLPRRIPGE